MSSDQPDLTRRRGVDLLYNPHLNKSTAFTEDEREALGQVGLLPEGIDTEESQPGVRQL